MLEILIGFVIAGAITAAFVSFWDEIKDWLNTVGVEAVEKTLGYSARNRIQKAISTVDRVMNKLRNTSVIYTKKASSEVYFDKTTIVASSGMEGMSDDFRQELAKHNDRLVQEFQYNH